MKKGIVSLLAVTTVLVGSVTASGETLEEALAAAYESNPQLLAQRAALRATDEGVSSARAGFLPTLSGTYTHSETEGTQTFSGGSGDVDTKTDSYQLDLGQNIFNGLQDRNAVRSAKSSVMAGRAQLQSVEQQVLLEAVTAYMNVLRDNAVVELNKNNVQVLERQLQASQDRFRVGEVTRTDVAQSEARLEGAKSDLLTAEATLAASRAQYRRVIGDTPGSLETPSRQPRLPESLDNAIELAMDLSPGVIAARYNEEAARADVRQAGGALLPSLDAFARWSKDERAGAAAANQLSGSEFTTIGVQLSVPLYQGGARHSAVRRAKQIRSQRIMDIRQAERVAQENVFVAWDQYRAAVGQINSSEAQVRASEIALEGVRQEAYVGSRTTLDVLNAEQELLNARVALVRAQRDEAVSAYTLVSATGKLTARDLRLGITAYNPEDNFDRVDDKLFGTGID